MNSSALPSPVVSFTFLLLFSLSEMKAYLQEHLARVAAAMSDPSITVGDDVGVQPCSISSSEKATGVS